MRLCRRLGFTARRLAPLLASEDSISDYPRKRRRGFETSRAPSASNSNVQGKWSSGLSTRVTWRHAFTVPVPGA